MDRAELLELAERVEAAVGADAEIDAAIAAALGWRKVPNPTSAGGMIDMWGRGEHFNEYRRGLPAYTASLDAAMTLVAADAPEIKLHLHLGKWRAIVWNVGRNVGFDADAATAPLALTAASLRALAAEGEE